MAIQHSLNQVTIRIQHMERHADLCENIASSLHQTGGRWRGKHWLSRLLFRTEYERARSRLMKAIIRLLLHIYWVRLRTLNPGLIQTTHHLKQMFRQCRQCPAANQQRLKNGQDFQCLLKHSQPGSASPFRFQINEKGQIIEHI